MVYQLAKRELSHELRMSKLYDQVRNFILYCKCDAHISLLIKIKEKYYAQDKSQIQKIIV